MELIDRDINQRDLQKILFAKIKHRHTECIRSERKDVENCKKIDAYKIKVEPSKVFRGSVNYVLSKMKPAHQTACKW